MVRVGTAQDGDGTLTVIRHGSRRGPAREQVQSIPVPVPIFTSLGIIKVGSKIRDGGVKNVEVRKEKHCECSHGTQLHEAVPESTRLIHSSSLVVLGIVRENGESLQHRVSSLSSDKAGKYNLLGLGHQD